MPSDFFCVYFKDGFSLFHVLLFGSGGAGAPPWRYEPSFRLMEGADVAMQPEKHTLFRMTHAFSISVCMKPGLRSGGAIG